MCGTGLHGQRHGMREVVSGGMEPVGGGVGGGAEIRPPFPFWIANLCQCPSMQLGAEGAR